MEELKILQKTYDMILFLHESLLQYPKTEKFALAAETNQSARRLLRLILTANKRYHKKTTLQDADVELDVLRHCIRLGKDLRYLPIKRYESLAGHTTEIGKLLGGWIKSQ